MYSASPQRCILAPLVLLLQLACLWARLPPLPRPRHTFLWQLVQHLGCCKARCSCLLLLYTPHLCVLALWGACTTQGEHFRGCGCKRYSCVHALTLLLGHHACSLFACRWLLQMLQASTASSKHGRVFAARDWVASLGEVCGPLALLPLSLGVGSVVAGAAPSGNLPVLQRSLAALGVVHIAVHTAFLLGARGKKAGGRRIE